MQENLLPTPTFGPPGTQGWLTEDYTSGNIMNGTLILKKYSNICILDNVALQHEKQLPSLLSLKVDPPEQLIEGNSEVVLPQVLEDVLALKNQRALELAVEDAEVDENNSQNGQDKDLWDKDENVETTQDPDNPDINIDNSKVSKNKRKKKRKKNKKKKDQLEKASLNDKVDKSAGDVEPDVEVE